MDAKIPHQGVNIASEFTCQDEYSLLVRGIESTIYASMQRNQLGLVPYFPLAGGALTGKYREGMASPLGSRHSDGSGRFLDPHWGKITELTKFAEERGHTLLELAMSRLTHRPPVASIIAGASKASQVEENARSVEWELTPIEMAEIDRLTL